MTHTNSLPPKIPTNIVGFDRLADGGLPKGRAIVISGSAGSGKTIFGLEFLFRGVTELKEPGVFVTFEERRADLLMDVAGFGWSLDDLEKQGRIAFVDASRVAENQVEVGEYDFGALIARIRFAVDKVKAKRVVIDSIGSLFLRYKDYALVRREMFKLISILRELGVTTVITAERVNDSDGASRFGVEDFVADSVVFLYNSAVGRQRERQIEIVKLRGGSHQTGRYPFLISDDGIVVFPRQNEDFAKESPMSRISIGVDGIDAMTDGGIFRGSTTLLKGPSGTGRTVLGMSFLAEGVRRGERGVLFSFEEGRAQIFMDAKTIGMNFTAAEKRRLLQVVAWQPEEMPLEAYLKQMRHIVKDFQPRRVVIDSVTPLVNSVDQQRFRRFAVSLNSFLKARQITTLMNYTSAAVDGESAGTDSDLAVIADNIITMDFSEIAGQMERIILIAKSRASAHDKEVRRYTINSAGMCVIGATEKACLEPAAVIKRKKSRK
ncbi:MAG: circadian clock protein KaiC [Patescibacteria group bacterium]|jgi:circadian clock protein KaiC